MSLSSDSRGLAIILMLIGVITLFIDILYKTTFSAYMVLYLMPEYSYLAIVLFVIILTVLSGIEYVEGVDKIYFGRVFVASSLIILSHIIYIFSLVTDKYAMEFRVLSIVVLIWGFSAIVFSPEDLRRLGIPLVSLLLLVPIPRSIIDDISVYLSKHVAWITSILTGAELIQGNLGEQVFLKVIDSNGYVRLFEVAGVCSGIVSILSILPIPLILFYFLLSKRDYSLGNIVSVLASVLLGLLIVLLGNIIRVSMIIILTKYWSYDIALRFFHSTPTLLYTGIAVLATILVATKLLHIDNLFTILFPRKPDLMVSPNKRTQYIKLRSIFSVVTILTLLFIGLSSVYTPLLHASNRGEQVYTFKELYLNISRIVFNKTGITVIEEKENPMLVRALGSSLVKEIVFIYGTNVYTGYLEVAESPSRFHSWSVCLVYQGYTVEDVWSIYTNNTVVTIMLLKKGSLEKIVAYSIYEIPVYFGGKKVNAYVRLSVFGDRDDINDVLRIFSSIGFGGKHIVTIYTYLMLWVNMAIIIILLVITYILLSIILYLKNRWSK